MQKIIDFLSNINTEWLSSRWLQAIVIALAPGFILVGISYIPPAHEVWGDVASFVLFLGGALLMYKLWNR